MKIFAWLLLGMVTVNAQTNIIGPWCGALTPTSVVVKIKMEQPGKLVLPEVGEFAPVVNAADIATYAVTGLQPDRTYLYQLGAGTNSFHTMPTGSGVFRFAFGSCAKSADAPVYETIATQKPLFYLNLGDLHYNNIATNQPALFRQAYDTIFSGRRYARLFSSVPFVYMWDDHDYGPNDSDRTSPSRAASQQVYREYIPHYALPETGAIYQTFNVGRVKFILTDLRSERTPNGESDNATKTMLGPKQMAWFQQELLAANGRYPLIFWVSSVTWVGKDGRDHWSAFQTERRTIANFIKENKIKGVCILTGDAHMTAADDGSNGDYADDKGAPIPVLMSSPLEKDGNSKGGPYSHGIYVPSKNEGMYGLVTVTDKGNQVSVSFSGRNQNDIEKVVYRFSVPAPAE